MKIRVIIGCLVVTCMMALSAIGAEPPPLMDGSLYFIFKGDIRVFVNGKKTLDAKGNELIRRLALKVRPGDSVVLLLKSPNVYRNLRYAFLDRGKNTVFVSGAAGVMLQRQPKMDSPVAAEAGGGFPVKESKGDNKQDVEWIEAHLPAEAKWLSIPEKSVVYDLSFKVPEMKP